MYSKLSGMEALFILALAVLASSVSTKCVKKTECKSNWEPFEGKCYGLFGEEDKDKQSFPGARAVCQQYGGDLVSVHSEGENNFLKELSNSIDSLYTGLIWDGTEYSWTDGTPYSYNPPTVFPELPNEELVLELIKFEGIRMWQAMRKEFYERKGSFVCKASAASMKVPTSVDAVVKAGKEGATRKPNKTG